MFDINFYMASNTILKHIKNNINLYSKEKILSIFQEFRSQYPIVYNIETTNACNMKCKMCPRTTKMDRKISTLNFQDIEKIIDQLSPHSDELWKDWQKFCIQEYSIYPNDVPSQNHFFLYIIPKVIQLHGYGDPLLDINLDRTIKYLTKNNLQSYFSCNPSNINLEKTFQMMKSGLSYLKYSFESISEEKFKDIRGDKANFVESFHKVKKILEYKKKNNLNTIIVITMINIQHNENQYLEYEKLKEAFKNEDVYIYLKSEDQQWYRKDNSLIEYLEKNNREKPNQQQDFYGTDSIHWSQFCKHPWMSMSIKSDGQIHMCMEDYNNQIYLGNISQGLKTVWNGKLYKEFRKEHFFLEKNLKCKKQCDMPKIGEYWCE